MALLLVLLLYRYGEHMNLPKKIFLSFWFKMNCLDIYSQAEEHFPLLEVLGHEVLLVFFWERVCSVTMAGVSTVE